MSDEKQGKSLRLADEAIDGEVVKSRAMEAYEKKIAGWSLSEIAEDMGFSSPNEVSGAISRCVTHEVQFLEESDRQTILGLELARLDALWKALYPSAQYGDPRAVLACLQISDRRMKWSGTDMPDMAKGQHTVLVVGGDESNYLEKLKGMANG